MASGTISAYSVEAYNSAKQSENRLHDDAVAKRLGFSGGLVPGIDVYAYMSHPPLEYWGKAFLERGRLTGRFAKPIYDGEVATVAAQELDGGLELQVEAHGTVCATGQATLSPVAPSLVIDDFEASTPPPPEMRPAAGPDSYPVGTWLGMNPLVVTPEYHAQHLQDVREAYPVYIKEAIIHPGILMRLGNWALMHNVKIGPWIHVGGTLHFINTAHVGDELNIRAKVTGNTEKNGRRFVELDGLIVANGTTPIAHLRHTAIYYDSRWTSDPKA